MITAYGTFLHKWDENVILSISKNWSLASHRWEAASHERQANPSYMCSKSHAYAMPYVEGVIVMSCRKKSLVKDRRIVKVLSSLFCRSLHYIPFWKPHWEVCDGLLETATVSVLVPVGTYIAFYKYWRDWEIKRFSRSRKDSRIDPGRTTVVFVT